jgi:hypothetical protein
MDQIVGVVNKKYLDFQSCKHAQRKRLINKLKAQNKLKGVSGPLCNAPSCKLKRQLEPRRFGVPDFACKHNVDDFSFPPEVPTRLTSDPATCPGCTVRETPVGPWPYRKQKPPPPAQMPDYSFVSQFEPVRPLPERDDERSTQFLIRVMRETAKVRRIDDKKRLLLDIRLLWNERIRGNSESVTSSPEFRAAFWIDCLFETDFE